MLLLSGGTGTPKLLRGLKEVMHPEKITVIVNTAEDRWVSGNLVCPDIDTVIYTFAELIDDSKWWGIKGDTFYTHNRLKALGVKEVMMIGDQDRATHVLRSDLLRSGESLTGATRKLCKHFSVKARVLPMSEDKVETFIHTGEKGVMHFQDFWITNKGVPSVKRVELRGINKAEPGAEVIEALESEEVVIIGPSNPVTSIGPILGLKGIKKLLREKYVIAISPFVGSKVISGPAAKFMNAMHLDASSKGVAAYYKEFLDEFVVDIEDNLKVKDLKIVKANTLMRDRTSSIALASFIKKIVGERKK